MEILLAMLLMFSDPGHEQIVHENIDFDRLTEAIELARAYGQEEPPAPIYDENPGSENWIKRDPQQGEAPTIRGVYATAHTANGARMQSVLQLIEETALNSIVIDIKEDEGFVTYETGNPEIERYGTTKRIIRDIEAVMEQLEQRDIYPIARIVVFKDKVLARQKPEWSFLNPDGSLWANIRGEHFVNPYIKEIWEYNVEVAKQAVAAGFKEIQFDYVRFPEGFERRADTLTYVRDEEMSRTEAVTEFVRYAREQLNPLGVRVSVDIFGYAASVPAAEGIGQDFNEISKYVDVISPMVYPSHYDPGWYGARVPDAQPYTTIYGAMTDTHRKMEQIKDVKPIIRPWIQNFTAPWVEGYIPYGKHEVEEQIRALYDTGVEEFLLWNPSNIYTENVDYLLTGQ